MRKKEGTLFYDSVNDRYDFDYGIEQYYGGFHCGDALEVEINGEWVQTCFEMTFEREWYLVGLPNISLSGLYVRV